MKTLVLYDSRHGFTEKCVGLLSGDLPPGSDLWPLRNRPGTPDWTAYDAVVFGGPVYFGRWSPRLVSFLGRHARVLTEGRLALGAFVVSLSPRAAALGYFSRGLPASFKGKLGHVACFGGGFTWKELAWWERLMLKRMRRFETDTSNLSLPEIQGLATWLSSLSANGAAP
jgi:menaquinone-dependent protoporphyrinogen IX oxidase